MKPYERYPTSIKWKGEKYELNLSYGAVFLCRDIFKDSLLTGEQKCVIALDILIKEEHPYDIDLLERIFDLLKPKKNTSSNSEDFLFDIEQDFDLIVAGFQQVYGIDLSNEKNIHFLRFMALLNGLPDGTRLSEVIRIRNAKVPQPNGRNADEISTLLRLKAEYALQRDDKSFNEGIGKMFNQLKGKVM